MVSASYLLLHNKPPQTYQLNQHRIIISYDSMGWLGLRYGGQVSPSHRSGLQQLCGRTALTHQVRIALLSYVCKQMLITQGFSEMHLS